MKMRFGNNLPTKAQSVAEYCISIAAVIGALIAMSVYISRGLQGNYKTYTDSVGEQFSPHLSRYNSVRETPRFAKSGWSNSREGSREEIVKPSAEDPSDTQENQIVRTISADVVPVAESANEFFSPQAPPELKAIFSSEIEIDYRVENVGSVVDDFSERKLVEDTSF